MEQPSHKGDLYQQNREGNITCPVKSGSLEQPGGGGEEWDITFGGAHAPDLPQRRRSYEVFPAAPSGFLAR